MSESSHSSATSLQQEHTQQQQQRIPQGQKEQCEAQQGHTAPQGRSSPEEGFTQAETVEGENIADERRTEAGEMRTSPVLMALDASPSPSLVAASTPLPPTLGFGAEHSQDPSQHLVFAYSPTTTTTLTGYSDIQQPYPAIPGRKRLHHHSGDWTQVEDTRRWGASAGQMYPYPPQSHSQYHGEGHSGRSSSGSPSEAEPSAKRQGIAHPPGTYISASQPRHTLAASTTIVPRTLLLPSPTMESLHHHQQQQQYGPRSSGVTCSGALRSFAYSGHSTLSRSHVYSVAAPTVAGMPTLAPITAATPTSETASSPLTAPLRATPRSAHPAEGQQPGAPAITAATSAGGGVAASSTGGGRQRGKCRKSYTVQQKLGAIAMRKSGLTVSQVAVRYGVTPKMVRDWCRHEDELHDMAADTGSDGKSKRKLHPGRKPRNVQLDKLLYDKYVQETARGYHLKNKDLQQMALSLASELGETGFRASSMFLRRWKRRYNVDIRGPGATYGEGSSSVPSEGRQDLDVSEAESTSELSPLVNVDYDDDDDDDDVDDDAHLGIPLEESLEAASTTAEADVHAEHGSESESDESATPHRYEERRHHPGTMGSAAAPRSQHPQATPYSLHYQHLQHQQQHSTVGRQLPRQPPLDYQVSTKPQVTTLSSPIHLPASTLRVAVPCEVGQIPVSRGVIATLAMSPESPVKQFTPQEPSFGRTPRPVSLPAVPSATRHTEDLFHSQLRDLRKLNSYAVDGIVCMHELAILGEPSGSGLAQSPLHPMTPHASHGNIPQAAYLSGGGSGATEQGRHFYQRPGGGPQSLYAGTASGEPHKRVPTAGSNTPACSVVLAACSNGHKLPISVIARFQRPASASRHVLPSSDGTVSSDNIWYMLQSIFLPSTRRNDPRRLLILPQHWAVKMKDEHRKFVAESCKSDVMFAPCSVDPFARAETGSIAQEFLDVFSDSSTSLDMTALAGHSSPTLGHSSPPYASRVGSVQHDTAVSQLLDAVTAAWDGCSSRRIQDSFRNCGI
ncbi:uncharacterized protein LOC135825041 [Sycon ciliatum]|uniref:uncharacterized protein LOC135825041 n=1 Tax=Sycon ciliatum TaxID=27933 RepID=UPI0031F6DDC5